MKISIEKKQKIAYRSGYFTKFKILDVLLKTHFKELMRLSIKYDAKERVGFIEKGDEDKLNGLVARINKSNDKKKEKKK